MKVLIGTPAYDGKLPAQYVDSLIGSISLLTQSEIEVHHLFLCNDALIQRARNEIFKVAKEGAYDYLFFIDADIIWDPKDIIKLIETGKDIVGGTYRLKTDMQEIYAFKMLDNVLPTASIIEVDSFAIGFTCISKKAIDIIWNNSTEYKDALGNINRMVFNSGVHKGEFASEDIMLCKTFQKLNGQVFLDTSITVSHIGNKIFSGDVNRVFVTLKTQKDLLTQNKVIPMRKNNKEQVYVGNVMEMDQSKP